MPKFPPTHLVHPSSDDHALIYTLLVAAQQLEYLPRPLLVIGCALLALVTGWVWGADGWIAGGAVLLTALGLWALLAALPRMGRSFGPAIPPSLALTSVIAALWIVTGLLRVPLLVPALLTLALIALAVYATWIEPFRLGVTQQTLTVPGWRGAPLRLLHLSDLHLERITARERRLNALIPVYQPDVIAFTGDFINLSYNGDALAVEQIRAIVGAWTARCGVYAVPGTPAVEPVETVRRLVDGLPIDLIENGWRTVQHGENALALAGMITTHNLPIDQATVAVLARTAPDDAAVRVLLSHAPDVIPQAAQAGFDLYLCGHTHGGQIRFPLIGAVFTASQIGRRYVLGRQQTGAMISYTVRGLGLEGLGAPRARLLCPPEIVLWTIGGEPEPRQRTAAVGS